MGGRRGNGRNNGLNKGLKERRPSGLAPRPRSVIEVGTRRVHLRERTTLPRHSPGSGRLRRPRRPRGGSPRGRSRASTPTSSGGARQRHRGPNGERPNVLTLTTSEKEVNM